MVEEFLRFGGSLHFASLRFTIGALLYRFPAIRPTADPDTLRWRAGTLMHGQETLPVRLRQDPA
ncbi:hypothetical protein ACH4T9_25020 [Micromonospora sp. NPDC020750]|uniref:hypothetical protein n=1 Tax=unclassified Micromonospora TaxID=2617518 RepID=UPI0037AFC064